MRDRIASTRRGLKPHELLLVGRLRMHRRGPRSGEPCLAIDVWCPHCKRFHHHGWVDGTAGSPVRIRLDVVDHRAAHCTVGPLSVPGSGGYYIGLDPSHAAYNRRILRQHREALAAWVDPSNFIIPGVSS
jgi:hypothetical protein